MELTEKLGRSTPVPKSGKGRILIHCASAGEVRATEPILAVLDRFSCEVDVVITVFNQDGRAIAEALGKQSRSVRHVCFLPWDRQPAMRHWLERLRPDVVAVVETEIWPNLFHVCRKMGIFLCIINGRIYPKDVSRYLLARRFFESVLECADWIGVQDGSEEERFLKIGATARKVHVIGNTKLDQLRAERLDFPWAKSLQSSTLVMTAASTHRQEEPGLLEVFARLRLQFPGLRLVIAPRNINRSRPLQRAVEAQGLQPMPWSGAAGTGGWDVLVVDRLGWLPSIYSCTDIAIIGGTFSHHGGHSLAEAAAFGCVLLVGPNTQNFEMMTKAFLREEAVVQVQDTRELSSVLTQLLGKAELRHELGRRAELVLASMRGSSEVYARTLLELVDKKGAGKELPCTRH